MRSADLVLIKTKTNPLGFGQSSGYLLELASVTLWVFFLFPTLQFVVMGAYPACSASFFEPEQCFSLTTIQPKQCFQPVSAKFQTSDRGHRHKR